MALLVVFALLAGAGTALTPCVLPVLPALLSAGATGGRRRPLGIVIGLPVTFTVTIVGLASVVDGVGLGGGAARTVSILVLLGFGVALLWPPLGDLLEAPLSRLARFGPRSAGTGFWSGIVVGAALGFVYAPCAGPILGAVISVAATRGTSVELVAVAVSYALGSAAVLLLLAYGGRRAADRLRRAGRGPALQRTLGVVLVLTAIVMLTDLDVRFQTALARDVPDVFTNPTHALERSGAAERRLVDLRGEARFAERSGESGPRSGLPVLGRPPGFRSAGRWFNSRPLDLRSLRGRVVLVDFWTYTCINCIRTFPELRAWDARYRRAGLTIVGVHTPEFSFEHDPGNVRRAIAANGLRYPVVQDNDYRIWHAFGNQYWPAEYLIDARGDVRYAHFGEGEYDRTEAAIRSLLRESGGRRLGGAASVHAELPSAGVRTPETYLGAAHPGAFLPTPPRPGLNRYPGVSRLPYNSFALRGTWRVSGESATAVRGAAIQAAPVARRTFLVMSSSGGRPMPVRVLLDGRPLRVGDAGADVRRGRVTVRGQRLYRLVELDRVEGHRLTVEPAPGVSAYAFTFG